MIDTAAAFMARGDMFAIERIEGVDDNMAKSHFHDFYELYFLEQGERHCIVDPVSYDMQPNEMVLMPPRTMHHSRGDPGVPFCRIVLYFKPEAVADPALEAKLNHLCGHFVPKDQQQAHEFRNMFEHLLQENDDTRSFRGLAQKSLLHLILISLLRAAFHENPHLPEDKIQRIIRYIHLNYAEDLTLDLLSGRFFISKHHLCREFKRYTSNTILEYLNSVRILNAKRLFIETDRSMTHIASDVGFSSLTSFERVFNKLTGQRPREFKQQLIKARNEYLRRSQS